MKLVLSALFVLFSIPAFAKIQVFAIGDIAVLQQAEDGSYDVVCTNGNREKVTDLDLRLGNVCPHQKSSTPTEILSLQLRDDGSFNVVCKDLSRKIATPEEIMKGDVCMAPTPTPTPNPTPTPPPQTDVVLEDGYYKPAPGNPGSYYDQEVKATHVDGALTALSIKYTGSGITANYACTKTGADTVCKSSDGYYTVTIIDSKSYKFSNGYDVATFTKQ